MASTVRSRTTAELIVAPSNLRRTSQSTWSRRVPDPGNSIDPLASRSSVAGAAKVIVTELPGRMPPGPTAVGPIVAVYTLTMPDGPWGPTGPGGPTGPTSPCGPGGPSVPVAPSGPVGPIGPMGPSAPGGPGSPIGPSGPSGPSFPVAPVAPISPRSPGGPGGPAGPVHPASITTTTHEPPRTIRRLSHVVDRGRPACVPWQDAWSCRLPWRSSRRVRASAGAHR